MLKKLCFEFAQNPELAGKFREGSYFVEGLSNREHKALLSILNRDGKVSEPKLWA
ncbi:competence pheromone ComX [Gorillibacterium massiliense]|uniref:competence pheromone ComX n=1 Tax=Gorillibacterium massiliense TaxID=1280390 RepID=UPI0004AE9DD7|nr:hypothetical protein [Gorillibacterium massiliense]